MRILIIGGDGMLGHQLLMSLSGRHEVKVTLRQDKAAYTKYQLFNSENSFYAIDIRRIQDLLPVLAEFKPEAVINAVGIVKQRKDAKEIIPSLEVNALFPHQLSLMCQAINARLIHISTDCIFDGKKGKYTQNDPSDAEDIYGKTKYLGEVNAPNAITLRTSIIGLELSRKTSLIEWFLAQTGSIKGFKKAIYTGITTLEMSRVIELLLLKFPLLSGVFHLSSEPINKYDLLQILAQQLKLKITINSDEEFTCDRSLLSNEFREATSYVPPSWLDMLTELSSQIQQRTR